MNKYTPISYSPEIAKVYGPEASVFLHYAALIEVRDEWFTKTAKEWLDETGLRRSQVDWVRSRLKDLGVLEEERRGVPCRTHYRINWQKVWADVANVKSEGK